MHFADKVVGDGYLIRISSSSSFQIDVTVSGVEAAGDVLCSRNIVIRAEKALSDCKGQTYDVVVLPGGLGGSKAMADNATVGEIVSQQYEAGRLVGAICAAPTALQKHKIALGRSITSYPAFKEQLEGDYKYVSDQKVVQDGNLITSQGPGTAFDFALKIVSVLAGEEKAKEVAKGLLLL